MSDTKNCPYCGEEIMMSAKKCKHCGEWFNNEATTEITSTEVENSTPIVSEKTAKESSGMWKVPIILFLLISFVVFLFIITNEGGGDARLRREIVGTFTFERVEVAEGVTITMRGTSTFSPMQNNRGRYRSRGRITMSASDGWTTHTAEAIVTVSARYEIRGSYIIYDYYSPASIEIEVRNVGSRELRNLLEQTIPTLTHEMRTHNRARIVELNDRVLTMEAIVGGERVTQTYLRETGVVINGVRWATRNVYLPGAFARSPEDAGMFYQFARNSGWPSTSTNVNGWDSSENDNARIDWLGDRGPCPPGWRVPTNDEIRSLINTRSVWTTINGVNGRLFGTAPNQIFLPASGFRIAENGRLGGVGVSGYYWSHLLRIAMFFNQDGINEGQYNGANGFSVRCVADTMMR